MDVDTEQLWWAVKNATLFCRAKTWNGGEARFLQVNRDLYAVSASDDFVGITTYVHASFSLTEFYVSMRPLKDLEVALRVGEVLAMANLNPETKPKEPEWWDEFDDISLNLGKDPTPVTDWEVNPERLNMLNRLEPKGAYPIAFRHSDHNGLPYLAFRYGPLTRGILIPLDRNNLPQDHLDHVWR